MSRVLITGAAGFIGMHTAIRFLNEGWEVIGLDSFNDYYEVSLKRDRIKEIHTVAEIEGKSFSLLEADLNSDIWNNFSSSKIDAVVHLAAQAGVRYSLENPRAYLDCNILGFQSVLEFVSEKKVKRFLYASSSSVYGKNSKQPFSESESCDAPESYYAATKRANELMAKSYYRMKNLSSIGLRFFTVYGPWGRPDMAPMLFANSGLKDEPIKVFNYGNQKRDFTYIDDIVEGIFLLATKEAFPNEALICNIGNGSPIGLMDFISSLESKLGKKFNKDFIEAQNGDVESTYSDTSLLKSLVDYKPKVSLDVGVARFVRWFEEYYNI